MKNAHVKLTADKIKRRKKRYKVAKLILLVVILLLALAYTVFAFIYNGYNFTISLDKNLYYDNKVIIYDSSDYKVYRQQIKVDSLEYFDNISEKWLPKDLDDSEGRHNGENYLAYSFYIENQGIDPVDFWAELIIEDVIKGLDEAIRFKIYYDGVATTYAKESDKGTPEKGTTKFHDEDTVMLQHVENFEPGQIHKYTIVMWLEGTDPECTDNILGGEIRAYMTFNSHNKDGGRVNE